MPPEPTVVSDVRLRRPEARDPFLAASDSVAAIRRSVAQALQAIIPPGTNMKLSNIIIDAGKVNEHNIVVEVRSR